MHGIPIGLKDNIDTAGILTTAASAVYADRIPTEDAECVRKLRDGGRGVPRQAQHARVRVRRHVGRHALRARAQSVGSRLQPRRLVGRLGGRGRGARMCAAALGTDTAASVRYPAACCGVAGLKATHGLASIRGIVPLSEFHDHVGPLARSVADCALVMAALAGFDPLDPVSIRSGA